MGGYSAGMSLAESFVAPLAILMLTACSATDTPQEVGAGENDQTCDGTDPEHGCDDCNPCTSEYYCVSCADVDGGPCSQPGDLPAFCAGKMGCVRYNLTTQAGQINDCFPVVGSHPLRSGECFSGVCK